MNKSIDGYKPSTTFLRSAAAHSVLLALYKRENIQIGWLKVRWFKLCSGEKTSPFKKQTLITSVMQASNLYTCGT